MAGRYLATPLRRALEKTILEAREISERGAADAVRRLGVAEPKPPAYLDDATKGLRRRLRAHARAVGDVLDRGTDRQETSRLIQAAAYAHWHRMLFARFLAERSLLRHPVHGVSVSLDDCRELAPDEGLPDGWAVAERYAASMLAGVFRPDDPVLALTFAPEHSQHLQRLAIELEPSVFAADDSLGWTYQFWRAAEKDAVNRSGVKIGADELPAVTQLFTEPYMVRFLLHNTLGAWWAGKILAAKPELPETAADEAALRSACALPGYDFDMLRFVKEDGTWRPAAGTYTDWPKHAKEITVLDPCCGSGHFLTEAMVILAALRQSEENLSPIDAVAVVLRDNLHGLEIDERCVQIAAFAVALTAWRIGGWQLLPLPHIACVGAPPPLPKTEFVALANGNAELVHALNALHDLFSRAPLLGSLIQPTGGDLIDRVRVARIEEMLDPLIERARSAEPERAEGVIAARGMADAVAILARQYTLQATNVPFLGRGKQHRDLAAYIARVFPDAKADLATAMLTRLRALAAEGGAIAAVSPQNWLFLGGYKKLREGILQQVSLAVIAVLGEHGFESPAAAGAFTALVALSASRPQPEIVFAGLDATDSGDPQGKAAKLLTGDLRVAKQKDECDDPEFRISVREISYTGKLLQEYASVLVGATTGDAPKYIFRFWEQLDKGSKWEYFQTTVEKTQRYGGMTDSILWEQESGELYKFAESVKHLNHIAQNWRRGKPNWGRRGVSISMMRRLEASIYTGERYDSNCCAIVPHDERNLAALWAYCSSDKFFQTPIQVRSATR
jgi:hypothetical protein